jgi:hypothetical protein
MGKTANFFLPVLMWQIEIKPVCGRVVYDRFPKAKTPEIPD